MSLSRCNELRTVMRLYKLAPWQLSACVSIWDRTSALAAVVSQPKNERCYGVQLESKSNKKFLNACSICRGLILFIPLALCLPYFFVFPLDSSAKLTISATSAFTGLDASTETVSFAAFASQSPRHHWVSTNHDTRLPPWRQNLANADWDH